MNIIKIVVALGVLIASPAFAQPSLHAVSRSTNHAAVASDVVSVGGEYIGQDPDANVRNELRRDFSYYLGNE
jgi:hypothetical protein